MFSGQTFNTSFISKWREKRSSEEFLDYGNYSCWYWRGLPYVNRSGYDYRLIVMNILRFFSHFFLFFFVRLSHFSFSWLHWLWSSFARASLEDRSESPVFTVIFQICNDCSLPNFNVLYRALQLLRKQIPKIFVVLIGPIYVSSNRPSTKGFLRFNLNFAARMH